MPEQKITLDFDTFTLSATLFDTPIAQRFAEELPCSVHLIQWGNELYGTIGKDLGEASLVAEIPPGGIAYTNNGNYVCIFFGQTPAWPVDHIGAIEGDQWRRLLDSKTPASLTIRTEPV